MHTVDLVPGRHSVGSRRLWAVLVGLAVLALPCAGRADDAPLDVRLEKGRFEPAQLLVPADKAVQIRVTNADPDAMEFESFELHRERVVQPGESVMVFLPALQPGSYPFFDDFHRDTPGGAIVAK